jgi:hypothetical protein
MLSVQAGEGRPRSRPLEEMVRFNCGTVINLINAKLAAKNRAPVKIPRLFFGPVLDPPPPLLLRSHARPPRSHLPPGLAILLPSVPFSSAPLKALQQQLLLLCPCPCLRKDTAKNGLCFSIPSPPFFLPLEWNSSCKSRLVKPANTPHQRVRCLLDELWTLKASAFWSPADWSFLV